MKREDDQELWDLLGKAGQPELSPFFARNVLRQIRQEPTWRNSFAWWFAPRRLLATSAVAVAMVAATVSLQKSADKQVVDTMDDALVQLEPIDYDVVADLDDLLAMEDDNLWSDADISTL
ncbi:MAG: hypothetical protein ABI883_02075 [Chthoniobacterales bacterium]